MAEIAELAGNLLAELYNAKEDARLGLITPEQHKRRIETIRGRREAAQRERDLFAGDPRLFYDITPEQRLRIHAGAAA